MASFTGTVVLNADDYDDSSYTNTTISAIQNPSLLIDQDAYVKLNTDISGGTVTAATIYWYDHSFAKVGRTTTYQGSLGISNPPVYDEIYSFDSSTSPATGWKSHALTSGEYAAIITNGDTFFQFKCTDPGGSNSRTWTIRAKEYVGDYSAYIVIGYTEATGRRQRIFVM
jgi:hypothetical protein